MDDLIIESGNLSSLQQNYLAVGNALLTFEKLSSFYPHRISRCKAFFQTEIAFIQTEILESYLDDLLDPVIKETSLYIKYPRRNYLIAGVIILGLFSSLLVAIYSSASGSEPLFSLMISALTATPFLILWHLFPIDKLARRMRLAQVLSQEISRRRGDGNLIPQTTSIFGILRRGALGAPSASRVVINNPSSTIKFKIKT